MISLDSLFGDGSAVLRESNFQLLLLAALLPVLGTAILSPVLDSLIGPFDTSAANIGLMISFFTAPAIVIIPIAGVLADRYGRKPVLVSSMVLFGLAGTAIAFTTDFRIVLALRLLQGVGFGGINPIIITSIGDLYAGAREATGQGLRFTVSGLSGTVFPIFSGLLVVFAWQYPFFLYAMALPIAAIVYFRFDEPTAVDAPAATDGGAADGGTDGNAAADDVAESYSRALFRLVRRRRVLSLVIARSFPNVVWTGFITYNSLIVIQLLGGTPPQAGMLVAVGSLVFATAASQAGRITAFFDSRFYPLACANVFLAVGFGIVLFAPKLVVAVVGITVSGIGFGILLSLYRSIITGLASETLRAGLVSLAEAGGRLTSTLTPVAMGGVIAVAAPTIGFGPAVRIAGLGAAIVGGGGGLLCLLVARFSPPAPAERSEPIET